MKKISIVVPVYNAERYIAKCIDSLLNQTYKNIEIILVNDGSNDSSEEIIETYIKKNANIIYISQKNSGPSVSRNTGILKATGDYIMFIDSDDYAAPDLCEKLVSKDSDLVMCKLFTFSEKGLIWTPNFSSLTTIQKLSDIGLAEFEMLYRNTQFNTPCCKLYKKEKILTLFREDLDLGEDIIFNFEYLKNCTTISYIDEALYFYRIGESSSLTNKFDENRIIKVHKVYQETSRLCDEIFKKNYNQNLLKSNFLREACRCAKKMIVSSEASTKQKSQLLKTYMENYDLNSYLTADWKNESISFKIFFFFMRIRTYTLLVHLTRLLG